MRTSFTVAPGFEEALRAAGLDRFERVMAVEAPEDAVTRAVPGRFTTRVALAGAAPGGCGLVVYLKRHRGLIHAKAAAHEWRMLGDVAAAGIPCPRPVAFGERAGIFGTSESFLMTKKIEGAEQADWWIEERPEKRPALVAAVASLARRFHGAGFHHQDLYLCHFFVREAAGGALDLFLIDLQRAGRHGGRLRWIVKDLAELHFSMGAAGFGEADWRAFLDRYGGIERGLARAILAKSARIARHVPKYG